MKSKLTEAYLNLSEKYGFDPYVVGVFIVLATLIFKVRRLRKEKLENGKIGWYEYPTLILGVIILIVLAVFAI